MTTSTASSTQRIEEAFARELEERRETLSSLGADWLAPWPASFQDKTRQELARAVAKLDPKQGRAQILETVERVESWFVHRVDAFARSLANDLGVEPKSLRSADDIPVSNWLGKELAGAIDALSGAMNEARDAAFAFASAEAEEQAPSPEEHTQRSERVHKAFQKVTEQSASFEKATVEAVRARWKSTTDKLQATADAAESGASADPTDHTRRAAERAAASLKADQARKEQGKKRRWYHWLIDITLVALSVYLIKTRFFPSKENRPAPPPSTSSSAMASAPRPSSSSAGVRVLINPTRVLQGPGYHFAPAGALSAPTRAEVLEPPQSGWIHVRLGPSHEGWVPLTAIYDPAGHLRDAGQ